MVSCSILYCKSKSIKGSSVSFLSFPKDPSIVNKWLKHCKPNTNIKNGRVCSIHFDAADYQRTMRQIIMNEYPKRCRQIKADAVPTLHIHTAINLKVNDDSLDNMPSLEPDTYETHLDDCTEVVVVTSEHGTEKQATKRAMESTVEVPGRKNADDVVVPIKKYKQLLRYKNKYKNLEKNLLKIFTPGQLSHLNSSDTSHVRWKAEDIAPAITLRSITPNGYRYLRQVVGIPYPGFSTLSKWTQKFDVEEGDLDKVLALMQHKSKDFSHRQRFVVLSFDEIYIWNKREGKHKNISYNTCLCVMVRSLFERWKQLIYYKFDQNMTTDILKGLIQKLYNNNLIVCAVVCDLGRKNLDLLNRLNIGTSDQQNTWFQNPADENLRVHIFIDAPYLLKHARNNFVEHGFLYGDRLLGKETLVKFLAYLTDNDLKLTNKLTLNHLNIEGPAKKKVAPAAELFCKETSVALEWCGNHGFLEDENLYEVSHVLRIFSEWFNVFNAQFISDDKKAFGLNLKHQCEALETMNSLVSSIKTGWQKEELSFQKGILISNKSLCNLFNDLQDILGSSECILTSRLSLDLLTNFFSYIKGMSFINDNIPGLSLKHRIKQYIVGKHSTQALQTTIIYEDPDVPCFVGPLDIMKTVES